MITREDIGKLVKDTSGRVGILCDVIPDYEDPDAPRQQRRKRSTAFLRPEGGGREVAGPTWLCNPCRTAVILRSCVDGTLGA